MNKANLSKAEKLFSYLGEIDDSLIEEAEAFISFFQKTGRNRLVKYGAIAATASGVAAAAYFLLRARAGKNASTATAYDQKAS